MKLTCPNPRCLELNAANSLYCHSCRTQLTLNKTRPPWELHLAQKWYRCPYCGARARSRLACQAHHDLVAIDHGVAE